MRKQPSQIAPILCSIVALVGRHSGNPTNRSRKQLMGRETYKFDHLDKTKDLAASSVGKTATSSYPGADLPRIPRISRTYFLKPSPPRRCGPPHDLWRIGRLRRTYSRTTPRDGSGRNRDLVGRGGTGFTACGKTQCSEGYGLYRLRKNRIL
jgi:hypothetical protein